MPRITVHDSFAQLDPDRWDALVGDESPFLEYAYLAGLELEGCAVPETGWQARPVTVHDDDGRLVAAAPTWLTSHSRGEYVYDHAWADAAHRAGLRYYPKLVVGVPFTPVTGRRLLVAPGEDRDRWLAPLLQGVDEAAHDALGVHVLFDTDDEAAHLSERGLFPRVQFQFHWTDPGYGSFDDFLARFPSKKRKNIRRERREAARYRIEVVPAPDRALLDAMYAFYLDTCAQFSVWGARYLNRAFFHRMGERWGHRLVMIVAYDGDVPVAGTLNVVKGERMYGRYWGSRGDLPFLHFELCYYRTVEHCIEHGITVFEPGHGGGHKYKRGFEPTITFSSHRLRHPGLHDALRRYSDEEARHVREHVDALLEASPIRR